MSELARIPVIKLYDDLIVSIQVALSDDLVLQLKDDVTARIRETDANGLLLDVSGIDVMDSYISRAIRDIGMISGLMGVHTVVCGLDPMIALTLVEMGMDLESVIVARDLETGLERLKAVKKKGRGFQKKSLGSKGFAPR